MILVGPRMWSADFNGVGWEKPDCVWAQLVVYVGPSLVPGTPVTVRDEDGMEADALWLRRWESPYVPGAFLDELRVLEYRPVQIVTITSGAEYVR